MFAGEVMAAVAIAVLGLHLLIGVLGIAGVVALIAGGVIPTNSESLSGLALGAVLVGALGWVVLRDLRRVCAIDITTDGTWILRGPFRMVRGQIAPDVAREVISRTGKVWMIGGGSARVATWSWAVIRAGGRTWETVRTLPEEHDKAMALLRQVSRDRVA